MEPRDLDLTDPPDSPDDERDELDEDFEEEKARFDAEYGELLDTLETDMKDLIQRTETLTFESEGLFRVQRRVMSDPLEAARNSDGHDEIQRMEDEVQDLLDRNGASDGSGDSGEGGNKKGSWNAKRWAIFIGVVVIAGLGILYEELFRSSTKKRDDDVPLPDDVKQKIRDLVQKWASTDDKTFWGDLASYVQNNPFTLADMVYFMQYTQQFFPLTQPFLWDHLQDKVDIANNLKSVYSDNDNSMVAVLNVLPTLTYHNKALPRGIQATCAQLAFADLAHTGGVTTG